MIADELNIRGLTGVDVSLRIAGPGTRAYAFLIDWHIRVLLLLAWAALALLLLALGVPRTVVGWGAWPPALLCYLLYHPVLEVVMHGRTPGKRMAGCRIVTQEGATPGTGALLIRNVFRLLDMLPALYSLGMASCALTSQRVRIGDLAAGTVLVLDEPKAARSLDAVGALVGRSALDPDAASLVRDLLDRWMEIDPDQATALARSILLRLDRGFDANQAPQAFDPGALRTRLEKLLAGA